MLSVVDLGISNLRSIINALKYLDINYTVTNEASVIKESSHIILPGVGSFGEGIKRLGQYGLIEVLRESIYSKSILGICLGMQLLLDSSEESPGVEGLGLIKGDVVRLTKSPRYSIPRIGWADSLCVKDFTYLHSGDHSDFYYIHSYHCKLANENLISIVSANDNSIVCAFQDKNILGCQFHPEKSHIAGINVIKYFTKEFSCASE